ncbi:MAG: VOC family protein [Acidobacteriaceae bacterium]
MYKSLLLTVTLVLSAVGLAQKNSPARPAITGIAHVTLFAHDIPKSQEFYASLLGWDQVPANTVQSGVRFYVNHSQYVELVSPPGKDPDDRLDTIGLATSNAEAMREYLAAHGIVVPQAVTVAKDGSRSFLVHDPDGNKIEFTQASSHAIFKPVAGFHPLSTHIIHAGFVVRNRAAADHFYKDLLGFRLYWQGGQQDGRTDYVAMQVPNGTDWLEYMLNLPAHPSLGQLGGANHFAPGVVSVTRLQTLLEQRGWKSSPREHPLLGRDGKWQLDLFDPDGTRVEFMEFQPVQKPCCAPFTGPQPRPSSNW